MPNLTEFYDKLSYPDKLIICEAWELCFGQKHSVALVPFLDKNKVVQALVSFAAGPNFRGPARVLMRMDITLTKIAKEPDEDQMVETHPTPENLYSRFDKVRVKVGRRYAVLEMYDEEGRKVVEEIDLLEV